MRRHHRSKYHLRCVRVKSKVRVARSRIVQLVKALALRNPDAFSHETGRLVYAYRSRNRRNLQGGRWQAFKKNALHYRSRLAHRTAAKLRFRFVRSNFRARIGRSRLQRRKRGKRMFAGMFGKRRYRAARRDKVLSRRAVKRYPVKTMIKRRTGQVIHRSVATKQYGLRVHRAVNKLKYFLQFRRVRSRVTSYGRLLQTSTRMFRRFLLPRPKRYLCQKPSGLNTLAADQLFLDKALSLRKEQVTVLQRSLRSGKAGYVVRTRRTSLTPHKRKYRSTLHLRTKRKTSC
jgi:hypothetical protein